MLELRGAITSLAPPWLHLWQEIGNLRPS